MMDDDVISSLGDWMNNKSKQINNKITGLSVEQ